MVFHMKTTLIIDDGVMRSLKQEAARQGRTISELVEGALRRMLEARQEVEELPPLPAFRGGPLLADVADRDALFRVMEDSEARSLVAEDSALGESVPERR